MRVADRNSVCHDCIFSDPPALVTNSSWMNTRGMLRMARRIEELVDHKPARYYRDGVLWSGRLDAAFGTPGLANPVAPRPSGILRR
jgi:hypothetical protein